MVAFNAVGGEGQIGVLIADEVTSADEPAAFAACMVQVYEVAPDNPVKAWPRVPASKVIGGVGVPPAGVWTVIT
jgi:hypothetical protein